MQVELLLEIELITVVVEVHQVFQQYHQLVVVGVRVTEHQDPQEKMAVQLVEVPIVETVDQEILLQ